MDKATKAAQRRADKKRRRRTQSLRPSAASSREPGTHRPQRRSQLRLLTPILPVDPPSVASMDEPEPQREPATISPPAKTGMGFDPPVYQPPFGVIAGILASFALLGTAVYLSERPAAQEPIDPVHAIIPSESPTVPRVVVEQEFTLRMEFDAAEEPSSALRSSTPLPTRSTEPVMTAADIAESVDAAAAALNARTNGAAIQRAGMDLLAGRTPPMETEGDLAAVRLAMATFRPDKRPDFSSKDSLQQTVAAMTKP